MSKQKKQTKKPTYLPTCCNPGSAIANRYIVLYIFKGGQTHLFHTETMCAVVGWWPWWLQCPVSPVVTWLHAQVSQWPQIPVGWWWQVCSFWKQMSKILIVLNKHWSFLFNTWSCLSVHLAKWISSPWLRDAQAVCVTWVWQNMPIPSIIHHIFHTIIGFRETVNHSTNIHSSAM